MKRSVILLGVLSVLASMNGALASGPASDLFSSEHGPDQVCFNIREGFPVPFSTINRKVELAAGELYTLVGWIGSRNGQTLFRVSLEDQPWLATAARKANPFYPVVDSQATWKKISPSIKVRVMVRAQQRLGLVSGRAMAWIELVAISDPQPAR